MQIDHTRYGGVRVKNAEGKTRTSKGNGDNVYNAMAGLSVDELVAVGEGAGLEGVTPSRYSNVGQFRMNLGNRLRGLVNKLTAEQIAEGTGIQIGDHVVTHVNKARDQNLQVIEVSEDRLAPERVVAPKTEATDGGETAGAASTPAKGRRAPKTPPKAAKKTARKAKR